MFEAGCAGRIYPEQNIDIENKLRREMGTTGVYCLDGSELTVAKAQYGILSIDDEHPHHVVSLSHPPTHYLQLELADVTPESIGVPRY